jgi:endonuclease YncB( thermonuclease family)
MRQKSLSKAFLVIAVAVALLSLSAAGITKVVTDKPATDASTNAPTAAPTSAPAVTLVPGGVLVDVVKIVDGDTIDVRAAQTELRVRFYGVNTTERGERCFTEATERTRALAGSQVQLVSDARLQDSFKRELRYVYTVSGESIDAALIREGLALAWREDGAQRAALIALEERARASKTGCLWSGS